MKKVYMKIVQMRKIAKDTVEMVLEDEYVTQHAKPGQFISISLPHFTLRRPISIADVNKDKEQLTILFKVLGKGTAVLSAYQPGGMLDCIGPNGNGFPHASEAGDRVLLAGGGIGVPPLYYFAKELKKNGNEVISVLGFQSDKHVFYEERFRELGGTVIVTDDGSYGEKGYVTDVLAGLDFDTYYACGPAGMLRALTQMLQDKNGFISLEERMGCGIGACSACAIETNTKTCSKKICHDGPVFPAKEVIFT
jgi:dihydroorotate dehydrogenase electron transfer subunit